MSNPTLQSVQHSLAHRGLVPQSRLARLCFGLAVLLAAWTLVGVHGLNAAYRLTLLLFIGMLLILGYRAFTQRFMWRLRNRLIVTYVFIGVIPLVLLATMGVVAGYLFAGQFSTFVVTTDVRSELRRLESANRTILHEAASVLRRGRALAADQLTISNESFPGRQVTAYYR